MNVEDKRRRDERFVEAIRQNRAGMFRVARMMLRSDSDAEEAVADATESAYAHLRTQKISETDHISNSMKSDSSVSPKISVSWKQ